LLDSEKRFIVSKKGVNYVVIDTVDNNTIVSPEYVEKEPCKKESDMRNNDYYGY